MHIVIWGVIMKKKLIAFIPVALTTALLIFLPQIGKNGVANGLYISGKIIIPSLFPFAFCVLFIMRSGVLNLLRKIEPIAVFLFGHTCDEFAVFLLSLIGGYPVGARLVKELYDQKETDDYRAQILLYYCVNAGPAFTVIAVGNGIFASNEIGYILLSASFLSSVVMAFICRFSFKDYKKENIKSKRIDMTFSDNFVSSAADASKSVFTICVFVILFSVFISYIEYFSAKVTFLKYIGYLFEVTSALTHTKNIYSVSFLLGFSGFCVWLQIISTIGNLKINFLKFALARIVHGSISTAITYILVRIFKPTMNTMTNAVSFGKSGVITSFSLSIALVSMGILFCISLFGKKSSGSFLNDVL